MSLRPIYGHDGLMDRLGEVLTSGRFPQSALFVGAAGVGKQRLALWVAQGLLCDKGPGAPCDDCAPCRQVLRLVHPDLHWLTPIPRPKASDPAKQVEEAKDLLGTAIEARRQHGLWGRPEGMVSHPLAVVRLLQQVVSRTPFSGRRKVVIVGDAEWLVVQEASQEAANALLKLLEEPPSDTTIIVTAADPRRLLPTIRSRLVTIRVSPVGDRAVRELLTNEPENPPRGAALKRAVLLADGSGGRALASQEDDEGAERADEFLAALEEGHGAWVPLALGQAPWSARGGFTEFLDALAVKLRDRAADRVGRATEARRAIDALRRVERAREDAQGNVNPQLTLGALASELEVLV